MQKVTDLQKNLLQSCGAVPPILEAGRSPPDVEKSWSSRGLRSTSMIVSGSVYLFSSVGGLEIQAICQRLVISRGELGDLCSFVVSLLSPVLEPPRILCVG